MKQKKLISFKQHNNNKTLENHFFFTASVLLIGTQTFLHNNKLINKFHLLVARSLKPADTDKDKNVNE